MCEPFLLREMACWKGNGYDCQQYQQTVTLKGSKRSRHSSHSSKTAFTSIHLGGVFPVSPKKLAG